MAPIRPVALVAPAIAKWQYVEEKARAVLDAFCHREVRLLDLQASDDLLGRLAGLFETYVGEGPTGPMPRWYCFGATAAGTDARAVRRQLSAAAWGPATPSLCAEMCHLAMTVLRECDIPAKALRLTLKTPGPTAGDEAARSVTEMLRALGEKPERATTATPTAEASGFVVTASVPDRTTALTLCHGHLPLAADGSPVASSQVGFIIEFEAVIAALADEDAGYLASPSVVVAPALPEGAATQSLVIAQRLRRNGIRTDLRHTFRPLEDLEAEAAAAGARLLVTVTAGTSPEVSTLTLVNLLDGAREIADLAELDRKVTQLLD